MEDSCKLCDTKLLTSAHTFVTVNTITKVGTKYTEELKTRAICRECCLLVKKVSPW